MSDSDRDDAQAANQLFVDLYARLRSVAHAMLRLERPGHTLTTTALVHDVYLRAQFASNPSHTMNELLKMMTHVLQDYGRMRRAQKRGGSARRIPLDDAFECLQREQIDPIEMLDLLESMEKNGDHMKAAAQVIRLRFLGGFSINETAQLVQASTSYVEKAQRVGLQWLRRHLQS